MDKRFFVVLAAIILIFASVFAFSKNSDNKSGSSSVLSVSSTNHVKGKGQKGVTLVEYGDFQCIGCFGYEPVIKEVVDKYSDDIYFQFRNLPLVQLHVNAFAAARAAEAAGLQNKYWEMHDVLYEPSSWQAWTNSTNPRALFDSYAQKLGLNMEQFKQDYLSSKVNDAINADLAEFKKTRRPMATPTFFLDGTYLDSTKLVDQNNRPSVDKFKAVLDGEIAKKNPPINNN